MELEDVDSDNLAENEHIGFVSMLDALGIRNSSLDDAREFIEFRDNLIEAGRRDFEYNYQALVEESDIDEEAIREPNHLTFGDTIIVYWPVDVAKVTPRFLRAFASVLGSFQYHALRNDVRLRGCFNYGTYIVDDDAPTVLGPAVAELADWYERAEWISIHATPTAHLLLESIIDGNDASEVIRAGTTISDVPFKNSGAGSLENQGFFCPNWPVMYPMNEGVTDKEKPKRAYANEEWESARETFLKDLASGQIAVRNSDKYLNTVEFYDQVWRLYVEKEP